MTLGAPVRGLLTATIVLGALLLAGCGSPGASQSAAASTSTTAGSNISGQGSAGGPTAPSGFRAVIITITRPDGTTGEHCVWLADDEASRQRGLAGVTDPTLGGRAGMLFGFPGDTSAAFWMRDTPLPLSVAWFDASGSFVSSADMEPCPAGVERCPTHRPAGLYRSALEVPLGALPGLGVGDGSRIDLGAGCP